ncbi:hypothetical protein COCCADRAFT_81929 [Bipolaris zeicola 26-R-13]|uniref:Uncharacterized protein n=1 Tax=Cochliobolus carbonum (strain 26-R-13) TaxID=930089 RepID=W6YHH1_COCC2|nr:uncharacterized protein COCCADRAFT_81929 [Bipolaris zeicola 26-R-13]EUC38747.1 hypothetical protein COCCADRAFT_81929 [Bipolaris zeicola 26-R-13]
MPLASAPTSTILDQGKQYLQFGHALSCCVCVCVCAVLLRCPNPSPPPIAGFQHEPRQYLRLVA